MKGFKERYDPADIELIRFNSPDIITTSGGNSSLDPDGNVDDDGWV